MFRCISSARVLIISSVRMVFVKGLFILMMAQNLQILETTTEQDPAHIVLANINADLNGDLLDLSLPEDAPFEALKAVKRYPLVPGILVLNASFCGTPIPRLVQTLWSNTSLFCLGEFHIVPHAETFPCADASEIPVKDAVRTEKLVYPITWTYTDRVRDAIATILERVEWKSAVVFYDAFPGYVRPDITSARHQARLTFFEVSRLELFNLSDVLQQIHDPILRTELNFITMCHESQTMALIKQAALMNDRTTGMISLSSWIVILPEARHKEMKDFPLSLDNIVVVCFPVISPVQDLDSYEEKSFLEKILSNITQDTSNTTQFSPTPTSWKGTIRTLLYKPYGRALSTVGRFNVTGKTEIFTDVFPNKQLGFNGRLLNVSTKEYFPFVRLNRTGSGVVFEGLCMEVLDNVAKALNFTVQLVEPPDDQWGTLKNGVWDGLIRQLQFYEVDLVIGPLTAREDRERVMDFTHPYFYDSVGAIYKKPTPRRWATLLSPFKWEVLLCLGAVLIGASLILYIMENERHKYRAKIQSRKKEGRILENSFWYIYGSIFNRGYYRQPVSSSGRVFVSFVSIFCIIMSAAYSGNLIAFLTITIETVPFRTAAEIAEQTQYTWGTVNGSLWQMQLESSNEKTFQKLWQEIQEFTKTDPRALAPSSKTHRQMVEEGNYIFFSDRSILEIWAQKNCELALLDEVFRNSLYGIGLPNHSPYRSMFSKVLIKFETAGLLTMFKENWWPDKDEYSCERPIQVQNRIIDLEDLQGAFYTIFIGITVAAFVLIFELSRASVLNHLHSIMYNLSPVKKEITHGEVNSRKLQVET